MSVGIACLIVASDRLLRPSQREWPEGDVVKHIQQKCGNTRELKYSMFEPPAGLNNGLLLGRLGDQQPASAARMRMHCSRFVRWKF